MAPGPQIILNERDDRQIEIPVTSFPNKPQRTL
jgi:hypothetical protein